MVITLKSVDEMLKYIANPTKATEQYFPVVLFVAVLYVQVRS